MGATETSGHGCGAMTVGFKEKGRTIFYFGVCRTSLFGRGSFNGSQAWGGELLPPTDQAAKMQDVLRYITVAILSYTRVGLCCYTSCRLACYRYTHVRGHVRIIVCYTDSFYSSYMHTY